MSDPLGGKVIITTTSKVKLLQKLRDFMGMKSILIQAKRNPKLMSDPMFLERTMEYLKTNTDFTSMPFWESLSEEFRLRAAQCMVLQEVSDTRQLRMISTKDNAAIYVILSGTAEVKEGFDGEEHILGPGEMFGNSELFKEVLSNIHSYKDTSGDQVLDDRVIFAKMHQGSYLRLSLYDMCKYVFGADQNEEKIDKLEYSKIAGMNWDELTDDDKFYVKVYLRTRNLVNKHFFAFLDSYRLVPKNSRMPAFKFYCEYERGKMIQLKKHDPLNVYVVIEGGIKIEIEANRGGGDHKISCKRKGRKPMVIKTSTMPIMQFDAGSVLFLMDECHDLGLPDEEPEKEIFTMPITTDKLKSGQFRANTPSRLARIDTEASLQTQSSTDSLSSSLSVTNRKSVLARGKKGVKVTKKHLSADIGVLYKINLVFDTTTTFLTIPYQYFEKNLGDEKRIMKSMSDEIKSQLRHSNSTVYNRIKSLESWIKGGIAFPPSSFDAVANPVLFDEQATLMNTIVPRPSETGLPPVGSFSRSHIVELDGNSSIESEMSLSISLSHKGIPTTANETKFPSKPNSPGVIDGDRSTSFSLSRGDSRKSKLKGLIDKMKSDQRMHLPSYVDDNSLGSMNC